MSDFDDIARRLEDERPQLSQLELDLVKQRVRMRADRMPRKGQSMRSRLAILLMLVAGLLVGTTGAGLAIQGATGNGNAAQKQYPDDKPGGGVLGEEVSNEDDTESTPPSQPSQPTRQVEVGVRAGDSELPFTGLAAIPIIVLGVALTVGGLALRRRSSSS
jgi:hypothetical protein